MKKLTCIIAILALLAVIAALTLFSCDKRSVAPRSNVAVDSNQVLIQAARTFMAQHEPTAPPMIDSLPYARTSLHKTPVWNQALVQTFSFGKGVVVPLNIQEPLSVRVGPNQVHMSASQITWLLLYQDHAGEWHPEVITRLPNDTAAGPFRGKVRVEDWQGHFLKAFLYLSDSTLHLVSSEIYQRPQGARGYTKAPTESAALEIECSTTDWYACYSYDGVDAGCDYAYSEEDCTILGRSNEGGESGGDGSPTAPDYGSVGGGGGNAGTTAAKPSITPDTSIINNPLVNCVYNHLMSAQLTTGLRSILSAFDDNEVYNISFTLGVVDGADGMCQYLGNNDFKVTINASEADDPSYSRIYLASTFLHEAFHAKLRQKALETFGEAAINTWPEPIDDMDLTQLANCFEAESKSLNIWENVEHDWMVNNIDQLGTALQQYVKTFYSATYASVGPDLAPYEDLMYMGLQGCTLYQEDVIANGLQALFQTNWAKLNEGGKCDD
jgi:hypothetical protein